MDAHSVDIVAQKIRDMTKNSLNVPLDFYQLQAQVPALSEVDISGALLYLDQKGLIKATNKSSYHGATLIKNFSITVAFADSYPMPYGASA